MRTLTGKSKARSRHVSREYKLRSSVASLSPEQERELHARMMAGDDEARNALAMSVLRWVVYVTSRVGLITDDDREDLESAVMLRVLSKLTTFDPARGRLTTWTSRVAWVTATREASKLNAWRRSRRGGDALEALSARRCPVSLVDPVSAAVDLRLAVMSLPPKARSAVQHRLENGTFSSKGSPIGGVTPQAAHLRYKGGLRLLRARLAHLEDAVEDE